MVDQADSGDAVEMVYRVAIELAEEGRSDAEIRARLVPAGLPDAAAATIAANVFEARQAARRRLAVRNIVMGAAIAAVGLVITAVTYQMARGGGHYIVAWGAVVFGAIQCVRGLFQLRA